MSKNKVFATHTLMHLDRLEWYQREVRLLCLDQLECLCLLRGLEWEHFSYHIVKDYPKGPYIYLFVVGLLL